MAATVVFQKCSNFSMDFCFIMIGDSLIKIVLFETCSYCASGVQTEILTTIRMAADNCPKNK